MSGTFEDLRAWQLAMDLVLNIYRQTQLFPKAELYGLTNQLRRAAVSIPSNIAEGKGHTSDRDFMRFLNHARGSLYELQTQIKIARNLAYLEPENACTLDAEANEVGRVLNGLIRAFSPNSQSLEPRA